MRDSWLAASQGALATWLCAEIFRDPYETALVLNWHALILTAEAESPFRWRVLLPWLAQTMPVDLPTAYLILNIIIFALFFSGAWRLLEHDLVKFMALCLMTVAAVYAPIRLMLPWTILEGAIVVWLIWWWRSSPFWRALTDTPG